MKKLNAFFMIICSLPSRCMHLFDPEMKKDPVVFAIEHGRYGIAQDLIKKDKTFYSKMYAAKTLLFLFEKLKKTNAYYHLYPMCLKEILSKGSSNINRIYDLINELLKHVNLHITDEANRTLLMYVPYVLDSRLQVDIARFLISKDIKVDVTDRFGNTALFYVAESVVNSTPLARELIASGASIESTNKLGRTALMHIVMRSKPSYIEKLIQLFKEQNANFDHKDNSGSSIAELVRFYALPYQKVIEKKLDELTVG